MKLPSLIFFGQFSFIAFKISETISLSNFKLLKGKEDLSLYQFNLNLAEHFFCKHCGIYTHHNRRTDPNGMGINLGSLDDVDPLDYEAGLNDGRKLS